MSPNQIIQLIESTYLGSQHMLYLCLDRTSAQPARASATPLSTPQPELGNPLTTPTNELAAGEESNSNALAQNGAAAMDPPVDPPIQNDTRRVTLELGEEDDDDDDDGTGEVYDPQTIIAEILDEERTGRFATRLNQYNIEKEELMDTIVEMRMSRTETVEWKIRQDIKIY